MMQSTLQNSTVDKPMRCVGLAGVLVGAVALIGVDLVTAERAAHRHHRAAVVQFVTPADAAITVGTIGATATLALALLLWIGRRTADACPILSVVERFPRLEEVSQPKGRDSFSISFRSGGLYGP